MPRLAIPTLDELAKASEEGAEIVACSALRHGPLCAMKLGLRNTGTAIVSLNDVGAGYLLETLKTLFPDKQSPPASPVKARVTATGIEVQTGHMNN